MDNITLEKSQSETAFESGATIGVRRFLDDDCAEISIAVPGEQTKLYEVFAGWVFYFSANNDHYKIAIDEIQNEDNSTLRYGECVVILSIIDVAKSEYDKFAEATKRNVSQSPQQKRNRQDIKDSSRKTSRKKGFLKWMGTLLRITD